MKKNFIYRKFHLNDTMLSVNLLTYLTQGGEFMKKIILLAVTASMLLTNVAFASTKTTHSNNTKNSTVSSANQKNVYHLNTEDPY